MKFKAINIFGGSGSGCSTIGKLLADKLSYQFLDSDDFYWEQTFPPYKLKINKEVRNKNLISKIEKPNFILAGSIDNWEIDIKKYFDYLIFLDCPKDLRLKRIESREITTFGYINQDFYTWAAQYEEGILPGRNLLRHKQWLETMNLNKFTVNSSGSQSETIKNIINLLGES